MTALRSAAVSDDEKLTSSEARQVVRRSLRMLRPYRRQTAIAIGVLLVYTMAMLAGPLMVRLGIDRGLQPHDATVLDAAVIGFLVAALVAVVLGRTQIRLITWVGESFLRDLRVRVFDHLQALGMTFFDSQPAGRLVSRMTSDVDALQTLVQQGLVMFIQNALLFVATIVVLVILSPVLAAVCLASMPFVVVASVRFRRDSNAAYLTVRDRVGQTLSTLQESLSGIRVVQAFAREESQNEVFVSHNRAQLDANLRAVRISARYFPVIELAGIGTMAIIVGVGGVLVHAKFITVGTVAAFALYLTNLFEPMQQLSQLFNTVQQAGAALKKLLDLIDIPSDLTERPGAVDLPPSGDVVVDEVGFAYGGRERVLTDVSLTVSVGERLALVGPTGAGKSTLAKLMARMYDPGEGRITFGGVDLRDATFSSLRERIVVVPQEGFLFDGTIFENVAIGRRGADEHDVRRALRLIGVEERFLALPEGLSTPVRERGSRLSAGERQLVSLARAALANPAVLVLDEATSSLDPGTEAAVEHAMAGLMQGRTVVVIAHRLSTAERADRVAVIDHGELVEVGTHDQLLEDEGRYAALFASWAGQDDGQPDAEPGDAVVSS
ncbi:MAG TPA: ABC transporter ATP-binding protein [Acidimicrobiales bacterium]|nr:ABC transporter ATP-binding protein [Acidimicrobiales bacterium]